MTDHRISQQGESSARRSTRDGRAPAGLRELEPRLLLSGTFCAEFIAIDNTSELTGYTTADLEVTTVTDWTSTAFLLELSQGSIYQDAAGDIAAPNPGLFGTFPTLEFDTYVDAGSNSAFVAGGAGDAGGDAFQFDTSEIDALWFDTANNDTGTLTIGRFTLSDDAVGTWSLRVLNAAGDEFLDSGSFTLGNLAPPIPQVSADEGDLTGDAKPDILWRNNATGKNTAWQMDGTTFQSAIALKKIGNTDWRLVGTGDFTGDGKNDILWRNTADGRNTVWAMNGTTFVTGIAIKSLTNLTWQIAGVGDFTGDGWDDILWRNTKTGKNTVWQMTATDFQAATAIERLNNFDWIPAGVSDFTGDGELDILWRNTADGRNTLWAMNGTAFQSGIALNPLPNLKWRPAVTADFTGDGKADILWRNSKNGRNSVWQMNNTTFQSTITIKRLANLDWQTDGQGASLATPTSALTLGITQSIQTSTRAANPTDASAPYIPASLNSEAETPLLGMWEAGTK